jgi:RNA polymerase sigma-70 factor (ECF subfamily)
VRREQHDVERLIDEIEAIYREAYPRFLRMAVASLGDTERARDAVHEAFVRAIRSADAYRGEGSLEAWLWRTLVNVCLVEQRHRTVLVAETPETTSDGTAVDWPEVRAAVAGLPNRQRTIWFLRHYADLDYDAIAATLGIARGTVAATLHTAHSHLREALQEVRT